MIIIGFTSPVVSNQTPQQGDGTMSVEVDSCDIHAIVSSISSMSRSFREKKQEKVN